MASFTIPFGVLGLVSSRTIYADNGVQLTVGSLKNKIKFGDGYKSIIHTSVPRRSASVTFNNREPEEINLIENYFIYLAGSPLNNLTIFTETWNGVVTGFTKTYNNGALYGLSATIAEQ